jgi:hypothetical protein
MWAFAITWRPSSYVVSFHIIYILSKYLQTKTSKGFGFPFKYSFHTIQGSSRYCLSYTFQQYYNSISHLWFIILVDITWQHTPALQQSTGATSGAGTAYPSIAPEFTADFCVVFYRLLFVHQQWTIEEISIFSNSSHLECRADLLDTILKGTHPRTIPARFGLIWFGGFCIKQSSVLKGHFLAHLAKDHVSFCHHLASVVRPSVVRPSSVRPSYAVISLRPVFWVVTGVHGWEILPQNVPSSTPIYGKE